MLRWITPFLAAMFAVGTAAAQDSGAAKPADAPAAATTADSPAAKPAEPPATAKPDNQPAAVKPAASPAGAKRVEKRPPPGARRFAPPANCRPACPARTTITAPPLPPAPRRFTCAVAARWWSRKKSLDLPLISGGVEPYAPRIFGAPLLPGSSTLPGYYGTSHSYSYDGPYYGGPTVLEPAALCLRRLGYC